MNPDARHTPPSPSVYLGRNHPCTHSRHRLASFVKLRITCGMTHSFRFSIRRESSHPRL